MKRWPSILGLIAAVAGVSAQAKGPVVLAPSTDWVLDYANERCGLSRGFGSGDQSVTLRIDSFGSWRDYRLLVAGPAVPRQRNPLSKFSARLTPDREDRKAASLNGMIERMPASSFTLAFAPIEAPPERGLSAEQLRALYSKPRPVDADFEKQVTSLEMKFAGGKTLELALGEMGKPLAAMRTCIDDLHKT